MKYKKGDWVREGCVYYYYYEDSEDYIQNVLIFYLETINEVSIFDIEHKSTDINLEDHFTNPLKPTDAELALWKLEFNLPYWTECPAKLSDKL